MFPPPPQAPVDPTAYQQQHHQSPYPPGYGFQPPQQKSSGATTIAVVAILLLVLVGGGIGAFFYFQSDDESTTVADDDDNDDEPEEPEESEDVIEEDEDDAPDDGNELTIVLDEIPPQWQYEPSWVGGTVGLEDIEAYSMPAGDGWVALVMDGPLDTMLFPYDPSDMESTIEEMITDFNAINLQSIDDTDIGDIEYSEFQTGEYEGLLAELEISWGPQDHIDDEYEYLAILMVDVGFSMPWVGLAAIPESLIDEYDDALEYLMSVEFH